jgi:hypothetical protein
LCPDISFIFQTLAQFLAAVEPLPSRPFQPQMDYPPCLCEHIPRSAVGIGRDFAFTDRTVNDGVLADA